MKTQLDPLNSRALRQIMRPTPKPKPGMFRTPGDAAAFFGLVAAAVGTVIGAAYLITH
jgi:hypothetical protein